MLNTLIGTKEEMTQVFDQGGKRWVGTWIQTGPCVVTQVKTSDKDGYRAVQFGYGSKKNVNKPMKGHLGKKDKPLKPRWLREVQVIGDQLPESGDMVTVRDVFESGDVVKVTGISKGKGFAGGVKRWGFSGGPKTHGQSDRHRAPGSIGSGTTPGRVLKGKKMAGRMGGDQVSVNGLMVMKIDTESNRLLVSGPVPGASGGLVRIVKVGHKEMSELAGKSREIEELNNESSEEQKL